MSQTGGGTTYSDAQVVQAAQQAGFQGNGLIDAVAIALAETGGSPRNVINNTPSTGDLSAGPWQINYFGSLGPSRTAAYGDVNTVANNLQAGANAAFAISNQGTDFSAWSTWLNGAWKLYYGRAANAVLATGGVPVLSGIAGGIGGAVQAAQGGANATGVGADTGAPAAPQPGAAVQASGLQFYLQKFGLYLLALLAIVGGFFLIATQSKGGQVAAHGAG